MLHECATDPENRGDLHEGFDLGWEPEEVSSSTPGLRDDGVMTGQNVWPEGLPGFRSSVLAY
jgi:isopenicillin N synthase-like dioxygenase